MFDIRTNTGIAIQAWLFMALGLFLIFVLYKVLEGSKLEHREFMTECLKYEKKYKCTAMWK